MSLPRLRRWHSAEQEFSGPLGAAGSAAVRREVARVNWTRMRLFFLVTMLVEVLLVVVIDVSSIRASLGDLPSGPAPVLGAGEPLALPVAYLVLHLLVFAVSAAAALWSFRALHATRDASAASLEIRAALSAGAALLFLGQIAALDQLRSGDLSVFTLNIVVVALVTLIRPPYNLLVYTPAFVVLATGILLLHSPSSPPTAALANASIFFVAVLIISTLLYDNQYRQVAKSTLLEEANRRLDHLSLHDQLTGLLNRRGFVAVVEREFAHLRRTGGRAFLAVADVDFFKRINDERGHAAGDEVLIQVADGLRQGIREIDAVARWGGEEFLLFFSGGTPEATREILERLRVGAVPCTLSFGFAEIDWAAEDPLAAAYAEADRWLYQAKEGGRNQVRGA